MPALDDVILTKRCGGRPEEVRAALAVPLGESEEEESWSLIRWFRRRYPTPVDRLAYVRRAYRRWTATQARP